jgi:hypothetical protein
VSPRGVILPAQACSLSPPMSASTCPICLQDYTSWIGSRPKKQCNKCARTVCSKCCTQCFLLPEVDRKKPKPVCDTCAKGGAVKDLDAMTLRLFTGVAKVEGGAKRPTSPQDPGLAPGGPFNPGQTGEAFTAGIEAPSAVSSPTNTSGHGHSRRPSLRNASIGSTAALGGPILEASDSVANSGGSPTPGRGTLRRPSLDNVPTVKPPPPLAAPPQRRPSLPQAPEVPLSPEPSTPVVPPPGYTEPVQHYQPLASRAAPSQSEVHHQPLARPSLSPPPANPEVRPLAKRTPGVFASV